MLWHVLFVIFMAMVSSVIAADSPPKPNTAQGSTPPPTSPGTGSNPAPATAPGKADTAGTTTTANGGTGSPNKPPPLTEAQQKASESVFGAGCRWDPTQSNIEEVSFEFRTGQAPPSTWFTGVDSDSSSTTTTATTSSSASNAQSKDGQTPLHRRTEPEYSKKVVDASYHTKLIDVLTFRARFGSFGSSLNSAGCALPAFSERLAMLEEKEGEIVNNYTAQHKPVAGVDDVPNAMFFWAGISNYDPTVRSDLIQTVVFYGDGCAANPRQGLCVYAAEYSNFRYNPEDHMCMGSNMPVFYPVDAPMTVVYRTQNGFRTQESWIDGKMVSYLRSAGDQVMNSFVITQECKGCTWPLSEQVYSNIVLKFTNPEPHFDALGLCTGGAKLKSMPRMEDGGKMWVIEEVRVPSGKHVTSTPGGTSVKAADGGAGTGQERGAKTGANADGGVTAATGGGNGVAAGGGAGGGGSNGSNGGVITVPGAGSGTGGATAADPKSASENKPRALPNAGATAPASGSSAGTSGTGTAGSNGGVITVPSSGGGSSGTSSGTGASIVGTKPAPDDKTQTQSNPAGTAGGTTPVNGGNGGSNPSSPGKDVNKDSAKPANAPGAPGAAGSEKPGKPAA